VILNELEAICPGWSKSIFDSVHTTLYAVQIATLRQQIGISHRHQPRDASFYERPVQYRHDAGEMLILPDISRRSVILALSRGPDQLLHSPFSRTRMQSESSGREVRGTPSAFVTLSAWIAGEHAPDHCSARLYALSIDADWLRHLSTQTR